MKKKREEKKEKRHNSKFKQQFAYFANYKNSKAYKDLITLSGNKSNEPSNQVSVHANNSSDVNNEDQEINTQRELFGEIRTLNFDEALKNSIRKLIISSIKYATFLALVEAVIFGIFGLKSAILGLCLGTASMFFGLLSIARSYKSYGIINAGNFSIPKMYPLRYLFYASIFLLSAFISSEPVWGIIGTFVGMINFKIVIFLFSWRW